MDIGISVRMNRQPTRQLKGEISITVSPLGTDGKPIEDGELSNEEVGRLIRGLSILRHYVATGVANPAHKQDNPQVRRISCKIDGKIDGPGMTDCPMMFANFAEYGTD